MEVVVGYVIVSIRNEVVSTGAFVEEEEGREGGREGGGGRRVGEEASGLVADVFLVALEYVCSLCICVNP